MHLATRILSVCCLGLSLLAPQLVSGHVNHGEPLNDEQAIEKAAEYTKMIIDRPEFVAELALDSSWQEVANVRIYKKNLRYFIVSLYNASQEKTLYVLLDSFGSFYGANFSGAFEGL